MVESALMIRFKIRCRLALPALLSLAGALRAEPGSLNLGVDYGLRGVATLNPDANGSTSGTLNYYSQSARLSLATELSPGVDVDFRIRSLNVWGLEGSGAPLARYPAADGTPWVERAAARLTGLAWNRLTLTLGRQPFLLGDGVLVSDDELGFNGLRADVKLPKNLDLTLFTAKISESLGTGDDSDLILGSLGFSRDINRWELSWLREKTGAASVYQLATGTAAATDVRRDFIDLRLFGDLKDAYYKLELAFESGEAQIGGANTSIGGSGQRIELGAQTDASRWGRFGVKALYASGSGDDAGTPTKDESFQPSFTRRWDGFERAGFGSYFGASLSDVFNASAPFSNGGSGLPLGASGVKTLGLGLSTVQKVKWTASLDYYLFDSRVKVSGLNSLGSEADLTLVYRHSGYVTFAAGAAYFFPGDLYGPDASRVSRYTAETQIHF